jgi:hypothetical protein
MWNKIYLAVLIIAVVIMSFFTFYSHSWLGSIGDPKDALSGYEFYAGLGSTFLWISTAVLLILANILLWNSLRSWAMWTSFAYFAIFIILRFFWLETSAFNFQKANKFTESSFFFTPFVGVLFLIIVAAIVFFNQFMNLRLNERMHPPRENEEESQPVEEEKL